MSVYMFLYVCADNVYSYVFKCVCVCNGFYNLIYVIYVYI